MDDQRLGGLELKMESKLLASGFERLPIPAPLHRPVSVPDAPPIIMKSEEQGAHAGLGQRSVEVTRTAPPPPPSFEHDDLDVPTFIRKRSDVN